MIKQCIENLNYFFFIDRKSKFKAVYLIIFIFLSSILELIAISLLALFVLILNGSNNQELLNLPYIPDFINFDGYSFFFIITIFFIFKNIFVSLIEYYKSKYLSSLFAIFHKKNMKNFLNLNYFDYKKIKSSHFIKNINFSSERTFVGFGEGLFSIITEFFIFFMILIILSFSISHYVFLGGALIALIYIALFIKIKTITKRLGNLYSENATKIFSTSQGIFSGFKEIRIFNKENRFINFFNNSIIPFAKSWMLTRFILNILKNINETIIICLVVFAIVLLKVFDISFNSVDFSFAAFAIAIIRLYPNLSKMQNTLTSLTITLPISNELRTFSEKMLKNNVPELNVNSKNKFHGLDTKIQIEKIAFRYENKEVLNSINLNFIEKKKYFIYGPSGSGKTTLLEIICGLLEPTDGKIYVSNKEMKSRDLTNSEIITYVPQEPFLVEGNLFENVSMFEDENIENQKRFEKAIKDCNLTDLINSTDDGLNMKIKENGVNLSSGQKQRIALARAFYKNRKIIVLDEPTSNLDKKTEELFMKNLFNISKDKVLIFVSHNLNYCESFDEIYLLKEGMIKKTENSNLMKLKDLL